MWCQIYLQYYNNHPDAYVSSRHEEYDDPHEETSVLIGDDGIKRTVTVSFSFSFFHISVSVSADFTGLMLTEISCKILYNI